MRETWKPIPGFPRHEASSLGRIRRKRAATVLRGQAQDAVVLKPFFIKGNPYAMVRLCEGNRAPVDTRVIRYIHRLVAAAFHANPHGKPIVAHCDGDRHNNRASNLRWATHHENHCDTVAHRRHNRFRRKDS